jgi:hypothetical protein
VFVQDRDADPDQHQTTDDLRTLSRETSKDAARSVESIGVVD